MRRFALGLPLLASLVAGCTPMAGYFTVVRPPVTEPEPGKALVVFLRPRRFEAFLGGAEAAPLYDGDNYLIHLPPKYQFAYQAEPGTHTFMITGITADFLAADLVAGKKYFVVVEPRPLFSGIAYSLRPQNGQIEQATLDFWHLRMRQIVPSDHGRQEAQKQDAVRARMKVDYYTEWLQKPQRPTLEASSGR